MAAQSNDKGVAAKKKSSNTKKKAEVLLDPVMVGDLITLSDTEKATAGLLFAERATRRCGVQKQLGSREPLNYADAVFRVLPLLKYRMKNELAMMLATKDEIARVEELKHEAGKAGRRAAPSKGDALFEAAKKRSKVEGAGEGKEEGEAAEDTANAADDDDEDESEKDELEDELEDEATDRGLRRRAIVEEEYNERFVAEIEGGRHKASVRYGATVQLQHVQSGLFLTVDHGAASFDPACRSVTLAHGSSAACFKFMPRFKAQSVGSSVYFGDNMIIESVLISENYLHTSEGEGATG